MGEKSYLCLVILDPCGKDHCLCWASGSKSKVPPLSNVYKVRMGSVGRYISPTGTNSI
jgi:hypothetical protein